MSDLIKVIIFDRASERPFYVCSSQPVGTEFVSYDDYKDLQEQLEQSKQEADSLALAIYNRHYKNESPEFKLFASVAGVITQINNMTAGLSEQLEQKDKEIERLHELHLERTRLTHKVITERDELKARNEKLERGVSDILECQDKEYTTRLIYSRRANKTQKAHVQWVQSKERLNEALRQLGVT